MERRPDLPQILLDRTLRLTFGSRWHEPPHVSMPGTINLISALEQLPPILRIEAAYIAVMDMWQIVEPEFEELRRHPLRGEVTEPQDFEAFRMRAWVFPNILNMALAVVENPSILTASALSYHFFEVLHECLFLGDQITMDGPWSDEFFNAEYTIQCLGAAIVVAGPQYASLMRRFVDWTSAWEEAFAYDPESPAFWTGEAIQAAITTVRNNAFGKTFEDEETWLPSAEIILNDWWRRVQDRLVARYINVKTIHGRCV